jgi:Xaa-Pro aminopeptidase
MSDVDLVEAVSVLRDEVLDTVEHGDRDPPGAEVFDALIRALTIGGESVPGLDLTLHDSVTRRLAWGDSEEVVLADAELVFDRLMIAVDRALRDPADRMVVIEAATQVAVTVARVVSLAAVGRASRDRAARMREEMAQRQLSEVLEKQHNTIVKLEEETTNRD